MSWGIVAAAFVFVQGPISFYIPAFPARCHGSRFLPRRHLVPHLLGSSTAPEPGPGLLLHGHRAGRHSRHPLSGGLLELNGVFGLRGIQWMFLVEGLLAVAVGIWAFFYLTDKPEDATWLPDDEREALMETIDAEDEAKEEGHGPKKVLAALATGGVWYFALIYFCLQIAVYGVTFFLPTQVTAITGQKLGFHVFAGDRHPWVFALVGLLIFPGLADRTCKHRLIGSLLLLGTAFGIVISGALSDNPVLAIAGLCLAAMGFVAMPIFWTLPTEHDRIRGAAGIGLINSLGNLRLLGAHPARLLQGNAGRECGPVLPVHRGCPCRSAVCFDRALQEGQRGRGWSPGRGRRPLRTARAGYGGAGASQDSQVGT